MSCVPHTDDWNSDWVSNLGPLQEWVLSLPWVVERPYSLGLGIRTFAVDCAPIGVRTVWLVTGMPHSSGLAVVVREKVSEDLGILRLGRALAPMPPGHVLTEVCAFADELEVERVLLEAYSSVLA